MTAIESIRELFAKLPVRGKDVVWLTDELLAIAQHGGSITLPDATLESDPSSAGPVTAPFRRLFRPLLARLAKLSADETGTEFDPYHGRYVLTRSSREGPVRLEIAIDNTPAEQQLRITRVVLASRPSPLMGNGSTVQPVPPQQPMA